MLSPFLFEGIVWFINKNAYMNPLTLASSLAAFGDVWGFVREPRAELVRFHLKEFGMLHRFGFCYKIYLFVNLEVFYSRSRFVESPKHRAKNISAEN